MSETDFSGGTGRNSAEQDDRDSGQAFVSKRTQSLRTAFESGAVAAFSGGIGLLWGLLTLARGDSERGVTRLLIGGSLVAVASAQRQSTGGRDDGHAVDQRDVVVGTADIGDVASPGETDGRPHATGDEARDVADSSVDVENAGSGPELDSDVDSTNVDQRDVAGSSIDEGSLDDAADDEETLDDTRGDETPDDSADDSEE
jgi:hypothetical protein